MKYMFLLIFALHYVHGRQSHFEVNFGLGSIVAGISDRVQAGIQNTADIVLGDLGHGIKVEYGGTIDPFNQRPPPRRPQPNHSGNTETVIVIIEEDKPQHHGNSKPTYQNHGYQNNYNRPGNHGYNRPNNGYQQNNGYNHPNNNGYNQQHNGYNQQNPGYNHQLQGNNQGYHRPSPDQHQQHVTPTNNQHNNEIERPTNHQQNAQPTTTTTKRPKPQRFSTEAPAFTLKTTVKSDPDKPFLVPLNPNEYVYGGDHINITAPKREADKEKDEGVNGEGEIDIRFGEK